MSSNFEFKKDEGLYYGDVFVAEFDNQIQEVIKEITMKDEKFSEKKTYIISIINKAGEVLSPAGFTDLNKIEYFSTWHEITDADLSCTSKKLLRLRLQQIARGTKERVQIICNTPGIYKYSGQTFLVLGDKYFLKDETLPPIDIVIGEELKRYQWQESQGYEQEISQSFNFLMNIAPNVSEILTYAVLLAVVKPFFTEAGMIPEFCVNLYGKSGSRKTSLVKALSDMIISLELVLGSFINDRRNLILRRKEQAYGFPFILDDYHPAESSNDLKKQNAIMDSVIRSMESKKNSSMVIMTSEFLEGSYSLQDRMLQVEMQEVDLEKLKQLQNAKGLMAKLTQDLVQTLMQNYDEVIEFIKHENSLVLLKDAETRVERHGVFLMIVAKLCTKYLLKGDTNIEMKLKQALDFQADIQRKHLIQIKKYQDSGDYVIAVHDMLSTDIMEFIQDEMEKGQSDKKYQYKNNQVYRKDKMFYITKAALKYGMRRFLKQSSVNIEKIITELQDADIFLEDKDASTKKFKGKRHLCISIPELENYVEFANT